MTNSITNRQMTFIIIMTLQAYSIITIAKEMVQNAGKGGWFTVLLATLIFALAAVVIVKLQTTFPGQVITDYGNKLVGKAGTKIISAFYILFFTVLVVFLLTRLSYMLQTQYFPKTPKLATTLFCIPVFLIIANKGITNVARLMVLLGIIVLVVGTTVHILMITQGELQRILPIFDTADIGKYISALKTTAAIFGGIEVLLIVPMTQKNGQKKAMKTAFFSIVLLGLFYILIIQSCIMRLGIHDIVQYKAPLIAAIREMEVPFLDFLKRLDIVYLLAGFIGFYSGIIMVFTAMIEYLCRLFKNTSRLMIVIIIGVISFILCIIANNIQQYEATTYDTLLYCSPISTIVIPAILLIIAKVKKYDKKTA